MSRPFSLYQQPPDRPSVPVDFAETYSTESLKDQNILITGASNGIGHACAVALAEAGAYVTIADLDEKDGQEAVSKLTTSNLKVQFVKTDVRSWESLVNAFKTALEFGPNHTIDVVMPNAGVVGEVFQSWLAESEVNEAGDPKPIQRDTLDVNLDGVYNTVHLALYYFKKFPGSKEIDKQIVFTGSLASFTSLTGFIGYGTSKWAVRGLFRSLRGGHRILGDGKPILRCNMICPNFVRTAMTKEIWKVEDEGRMKMARVSEVSDVVLRICADRNIIERAISINAGHNFDFRDDTEGMDGGPALAVWRKQMESQSTES